MLIKFVGALLVIGSATIWGFLKADSFMQRKKSIITIKTALTALESEIVFSSYYLNSAFINVEKICACKGLFSGAAANIKELGAAKAWEKSVNDTRKKLKLEECDAEILLILGTELGKTSREQQIKSIKHVQSLLEKSQLEAEEAYQKSARLYRSMGILIGLFIVIILI